MERKNKKNLLESMEEDYQQCQQVIAEMLIDIRDILIKIERK